MLIFTKVQSQARIQEKIWPWLTLSDPSPPRKIFEIQSHIKTVFNAFWGDIFVQKR